MIKGNFVFYITLRISPRLTRSTLISFSVNIWKSSVIVTNRASVAFKDNNLERASEVLP